MKTYILKDNFSVKGFCTGVAINYSLAYSLEEKVRVEKVLKRQIVDKQISDEGEINEEYLSLMLIEIKPLHNILYYVLAIIDTEMYDYSDFLEDFNEKDREEYKREWDKHLHDYCFLAIRDEDDFEEEE